MHTHHLTRRIAAGLAVAALATGVVSCSNDEDTTETAAASFTAQESTGHGNVISPEELQARQDRLDRMGDGDSSEEFDVDAFINGGRTTPQASAAPSPTGATGSSGPSGSSGSRSTSLPANSPAVVDAAADGSKATKGPEKHTADIDVHRNAITTGGEVEYSGVGGTSRVCTIAAIGELDGHGKVALTAGHCARKAIAGGNAVQWRDSSNQLHDAGDFLSGWVDEKPTFVGDYGILDIPEDAPRAARLLDTTEFSNFGSASELTTDDVVCKRGRSTGETCGKLLSSSGNIGYAAVYSESGDSGAPVYKRNADGTATLLGIMYGSPATSAGEITDNVAGFTWINPVRTATGVSVYGN